jgi:hypothetical protein
MQTRKLDARAYDTDKAEHAHYLRNYEEYFRPLLDRDVKLLELGIYRGGSLLLWRDYFQKGLIVGLDLQASEISDESGRIRTYQGEQQDTQLLDLIGDENAPEGFDVIIDDCSHIGELTRISFWHLFDNHLKPGGLYVIEDWSTGYWRQWFDGVSYDYHPNLNFRRTSFKLRSAISRLQKNKITERLPLVGQMLELAKRAFNRRQFHSHDYGLVGFIKELVDECGMADITRADRGTPPYRPSKFKEMKIVPGQVFIVKQ